MKKSNLVIVRIGEGIGNQMFQYAYARALKEKGVNVKLDLDKTFDKFFKQYKNHDLRQNSIQNFNITLEDIDVERYGKYNYIKCDNFRNKIIYNLAKYGMWKYKLYDEDDKFHIKKAEFLNENYYMRCWLQNEKYFKQIRSILLKELRPKKKIHISKILLQAVDDHESVSLHIRRGDYVRIHNNLNIDYYSRAVELIKRKYNNPKFIIFSEDLDWVKTNLKIEDECIYVNEDKKLQDYEELLIMSRCKANIISNSTFSWWGAWLNSNVEKIVIAPKHGWFPKQKNIIPQDWIVI